ncbi:MAG: hypothetical protein JNM22_08590 [Saprospiraceae bacterium]|nr:hypothetical protein [Saprospiraceae bacterium]
MQRFIFPDFVAKFPPVPMPVTLGEDTHHTFGVENEPLPDAMIEQFILPAESSDAVLDEFTEYVPCFAIEDTEQFIALVWWKATLLHYEYYLATFTLKGELIDCKVIAQTNVVDNRVFRSVAHINEEYEITIGEGTSSEGGSHFDPTTSKTRFMEIMANGEIA